MKVLELSWKFIKKGKLLSIFMVLLSTLAVMLLIHTLGRLQFTSYTLSLYEKSSLDKALYFMPNYFNASLNANGISERNQIIDETKKQIQGIDGVKYCAGESFFYGKTQSGHLPKRRICAISQDFLYEFHNFDLSAGKWFSPDLPQKDSVLNAVVGGIFAAGDFHVGDLVDAEYYENVTNKVLGTVKLRIIGILKSPGYSLTFDNASDFLYSDVLLKPEECFLIEDSARTRQIFGGSFDAGSIRSANFFIAFEDNITSSQKAAATEALDKMGNSCDAKEMISNSKAYIRMQLAQQLPMTVFLLLSSAIAFISVFTLKIYDSLSDFSIYYICGASWKRCFAYAALGMAQLCAVPLIAGGVYIRLVDLLRRFNGYYLTSAVDASIFNGFTFLSVLIFLCVSSLIAILIPYRTFQRKTPQEIYRNTKA